MPEPYKPPLPRRTQAVDSAGPSLRWRWAWLPLLGLVPLFAIVVLASQGRLSNSSAPAPTAADAIPTSSTQTAAATTPAASATAAPTAAAGTAASSGASGTPAAGTPTAAEGAEGPTSGPFRAYRVQPGDTIRLIAERYGVTTSSIAQASGLQNPDQLRVGQVLTIPAQPGTLYRVQQGDTLETISSRTGIPVDSIVQASEMQTASVKPGDVVLLPDRSTGPANK